METKITMLLARCLHRLHRSIRAGIRYAAGDSEQAAQGWHETYTDKYGRTRQVDIDIEASGEERAPVIKACWDDPV
ncbi:MAG: hypothetical protein V8Q79_05865 [Christensenellales bacterium]